MLNWVWAAVSAMGGNELALSLVVVVALAYIVNAVVTLLQR